MLPITIILCALFFVQTKCLTPDLQSLNYSQTYDFTVNSSKEYILQFTGIKKNFPPRVSIVSNNAKLDFPLMIVARQPKQMISWQLPHVIGKKEFNKVARTLCYDVISESKYTGTSKGLNDTIVDNPIVSVSTKSEEDVHFSILVDYEEQFYVNNISITYNFSITPSEPRYYFYNFTATNKTSKYLYRDYTTVILKIESPDTVCMTVSIQNVSCPVLDLNEDITFRGFYETMNTRGGITVPQYKFPYGFYIVFVAKAEDDDCWGLHKTQENRTKSISLRIIPSISLDDYGNAVLATLGSIFGFYLLFGVGFLFYSYKGDVPRQMQYVEVAESTSEIMDGCDNRTEVRAPDSPSLNEDEYDRVSEVSREKEIRLTKSVLYLTDLARKDPRVLSQKSNLYLYNVLTVALFYALPTIQLVITYQRVLNETGQQDLCYYNFLCAHPVGFISDFNHLFSNIGYVLLGILFLLIAYIRNRSHKDLDFDKLYGIPQHYGMFYAMGVSLVMEGVLSGSYHICPNRANFQFDSSFMYIMSVLCIVKLYQNRHPDINANAYTIFGILAVIILLGMIGIMEGNLYFWICFIIFYIIMVIYLSAQVYYMGCWKFDRTTPLRVYRNVTRDARSGILNVFIPNYKARMVLIIIGNVCNYSLATWGLINHEDDFAKFLLAIFMCNTLLYFFFYIIMKCLHTEKIRRITWAFLFISICCASGAMYFFVRKSISWAKTPAESRQYNTECKLFKFYDFHDIWHFLSAIGMFFTFMCLLTLDDDLSHTHRSLIPVF